MSLGDHDVVWGPNYFYTEEVMELLHIFHFELAEEELLDVIDIGYVLSSNDQIVNNNYPLEPL